MMEALEQQVRRAYRRMGFQRFAGVLGWCWCVALIAALVAIIAGRFYPLKWDPGFCGAAALGLGLLAAVGWMALTRRETLEAAIEIDRRFALKERISSTLAMSATELDSQAGRALVDDALRRIKRIDVAERFAVTPPGSCLLPLLPGVAAVLVAFLFDPAVIEQRAAAETGTEKPPKLEQPIRKVPATLHRRLAERRELAEKMKLKEAEKFLKKLEDSTKALAEGKQQGKQALAKLNDLARELQQRRKKIGGADAIRRQLNQVKHLGAGPAEKLAKALSRGDFQGAADALQEIQDDLAAGKLDQQKQELARQLDQLQQKLGQLAAAHRAAREDLQQRADRLRADGRVSAAERLQEQIQKLRDSAPQMEQLKELADGLKQCGNALNQGRPGEAAAALQGLQAGLNNLQQQLDEMPLLDSAMDQLRQARNQMTREIDRQGPGIGHGLGGGLGPETDAQGEFYDSHVPQKVGKAGTFVLAGPAGGPNRKGSAEQAIEEQFDTVRRASTDPLTGRQIPRKLRLYAEEYFNRFREGD